MMNEDKYINLLDCFGVQGLRINVVLERMSVGKCWQRWCEFDT